MNIRCFFSQRYRFSIPFLAAIGLVGLVWGSLAFSDQIHDAAAGGDLAKVKALLEANPDLVNAKGKNDKTPLHLAAYAGHKDVVALLLASKADANAQDEDGRKPLRWAAGAGHKDVVALLRQHGGH